jgi:predicted metalloprotease with PDZ domain
MKRLFCAGALVGALTLSMFAHAHLSYTVSDGSVANKIKVILSFKANSDDTKLQMPNWAPGAYRYSNAWKRITETPVVTVNGNTIAPKRTEEGKIPVIVTWSAPTKKGDLVLVSYEVESQMAEGVGHYSGPSTYMYPVGRTQESCILNFAFTKPTPIAIGLMPTKDNLQYKVDTYDHLADNPVTFGDFRFDTYVQRGKTHFIVYRGPSAALNGVDREYVKKSFG